MKTTYKLLNLLMGVLLVGLFGCSSETGQFSPEQVINNALDGAVSPITYYAEAETKISEKGEEVEHILMKEWRNKEGKYRLEMANEDESEESIIVNDGTTITTYDVMNNQAYIIDDPELLALNQQQSPKEQANFLLQLIIDTHEITVKEKEEILGKPAYHIVAKSKDDNSLFGDIELWIDKENWMVLKTIFSAGDSSGETVYTKVDLKANITDDLFTLDLPDNVEMITFDDMSDVSEVTLEEAAASIGQPMLYFPENDELRIATIEKDDIDGAVISRTEINMEYMKDDLPYFSLSLFETPEDMDEDIGNLPGEEEITVRGQEGSFIDMDGFRTLTWSENGLNYSILVIDPNLTIEELVKKTEDMATID